MLWVSTKSSSSSSTSRTRNGSALVITALLRQFDQVKPVTGQPLHGAGQLLEGHRLGHERVDPEVVGAHDVLLRAGGGEDHDGDAAQVGSGLDLAQSLGPVLLGHVEVQEDEAGARRGDPAVAVGALPAEVVHEVLAVDQEAQVV